MRARAALSSLPWPVDRLTRIQAKRVRTVEIGFRSIAAKPDSEPAAYEWNVQHRSGRFQRRPEESLMLAGDQNMIEVNAVVHYRLAQPDEFLFRQLDGESTVRDRGGRRAALRSPALLRSTTCSPPAASASRRASRAKLQARLDRYAAGVEVLHVQLLDVHPSLEVVDAFRDVSGAYEEKNRLINEAEGVSQRADGAGARQCEGADRGRRRLFAGHEEPLARRREPFPAARSRLSRRVPTSPERACISKPWSRSAGQKKNDRRREQRPPSLILARRRSGACAAGAAALVAPPKGPIE